MTLVEGSGRSQALRLLLIAAMVIGGVVGMGRCGRPSSPDAEGTGDVGGSERTSAPSSATTDVGSPVRVAPRRVEPIIPSTRVEVEGWLAVLEVAPETDPGGYDRDRFPHWSVQDDGCDTRERVLLDEAIGAVQVDIGCTIVAGDWRSPYDGVEIDDTTEVHVDHLVALHEAWQSGAAAWDEASREAFANDLGYPGSLVAVSAASNQSKGDRDPGEWRPPRAQAWCRFATDWVAVKYRWGLSADRAEIDALDEMLSTCLGGRGTAGVEVAPSVGGAPGLTGGTSPDDAAHP